MRYIIFFLLLFAFAGEATAQEETLFNLDGEKGGFGGPVVKFTSIKNQTAVMAGGRGGWIIDHSLVLGGGAYAIVNDVDAPTGVLPLEGPLDIEFAYFGFEMEYIFDPMSLAHFSIYTLLGGGATNFVKDVGSAAQSNQQVGETGFMFVAEPAVNAELNFTTWFRMSAGVSYRIVTGLSQVGLKNSDFSGVTATLTLKFGTF